MESITEIEDSPVSEGYEERSGGNQTGKLYAELISVGECEFTGSYQITGRVIFTIGRSSESSLKIAKIEISRKHCTIEKLDLGWVLTSHSNGGTKLMGSMLEVEKPSTLRCGDTIVIAGPRKFRFKCNANDCRKCNDSVVIKRSNVISSPDNIRKSCVRSAPITSKKETDRRSVHFSLDENQLVEYVEVPSCEEQKETANDGHFHFNAVETRGSTKRRLNDVEEKLQDGNDVKAYLELCQKRQGELLQTISDMKKKINNYEIMKMEFDYYKEITKKREDATQDIDNLKKEIVERKEGVKSLEQDVESLLAEKKKLKNRVRELEEESKKEGSNTTSDSEKADEILEQELTCSICSNLLVEPTVTACNHTFCSWCLETWSKNQKVCPMCRSPLVKYRVVENISNVIACMAKIVSEDRYNEYQELIAERATIIPKRKTRRTTSRRARS